MEIKELKEELLKTWEAFKKKNEELEAEIKKYGEGSQELKNTIEALNGRLDSLETKLNRPGTSAPSENKHKENFLQFMRKGIVPSETKATFIEGTGNIGGYTVAPEYVRELITATLTELDPIRQYARVITTSSNTVNIPTITNFATASWASDEVTTQRSATNASTPFGQVSISVYEMYAICDISNDLLEDSMFDLEAEVRRNVGTQLAYTEGAAFVAGDGSAKPTGILTSPASGSIVTTGVADNWPTTNPADKIFEVFFTLKEPYASKGVWGLNRATLSQIRRFKDSTGNYIWSPGIADVPSTILGRPYFLAPSWHTTAANKYILGFADWQNAYCIVDRNILTVLRDPYTKADYNTTRFIFRYRVGGKPLVSEAFATLKCATS